MKRRLLLWRVYPYYLLIIVAALALTALFAAGEMRRLYINGLAEELEAHARLVVRQLKPLLADSTATSVDHECKELAGLSDTRITVIDTTGAVLGDSEKDPRTMENHGSRPEIAVAFTGATGMQTRFSNSLQITMIYVAIPIESDGRIVGVVRTSRPITNVEGAMSTLYGRIAVGGLLVAGLAMLMSFVVMRRLTRPLRELQEGARRFARGDLALKLPVPDTAEIAALAVAMNRMAAQLDARMRAVAQERNEREAILSSMAEGVLALDTNEKIASMNQAAARLLNLDALSATGRPVRDVLRSTALYDLIDDTFKSLRAEEREMSFPAVSERRLLVHGAALRDAAGERCGTVLVFNDITRLKKLESIRREFVANVSHELKTPITAIIGSVETLQSHSADSPEDTARFLDMIAKHSDRLNSLVDDLLTIARLESEAERDEIVLTRDRISDVLEAAVQACREIAAQKQVTIDCDCDDSFEADIHPTQLEQAVTNLIDNAIKYSDAGSTVAVAASEEGDEVVISVQDQGCGIESKHLPRLFERFYRVDRARSREAGGTGLGLAIVKHIVLAHKGHITVDSTPGAGSTFRIHLPRP